MPYGNISRIHGGPWRNKPGAQTWAPARVPDDFGLHVHAPVAVKFARASIAGAMILCAGATNAIYMRPSAL